MTNEPGGSVQLSHFWGVIQRGVQDRLPTADLWAAVRGAAAAEGFGTVRGGIAGMNSLRGLAAGLRNASAALAAAPLDSAITNDYLSTSINSRPLDVRAEAPAYQVRFEHTVITQGGEQVTTWRTVQYSLQLPATKAQLLNDIAANAELLAGDYQETHVGVGAIEIAVV